MSRDDEKEDASRFAWFNGASLEAIAEFAAAAALGGRMEVHRLKNEGVYLEFYNADGEEIGGVNDSFLCPPVCP